MRSKLICTIHKSIFFSWLSIFSVCLHLHQLVAQPSIAEQTVQQLGNSKSTDTDGVQNRYIQVVKNKVLDYLRKYPNLKMYPPKKLLASYPLGITCSQIRQPPFILLLVVTDKVPVGEDINLPAIPDSWISTTDNNPVNKNLLDIVATIGMQNATKSDRERPAADRDKPVLYQYQVEFDPKSCNTQ